MSAQVRNLKYILCIFFIIGVSHITDFKAFLRLMQIRLANNQSIFIFLTYQFPSSGIHIRNTNRRRISRAAVHKLVKKHLAAAGLDSTQYSSHKLRHTAATLMLQNGVDVRTLQEVLGHDHLNTTQIYTHVDNEDLRTAARANPLGRVKKRGRPPKGQDGTE